MECKKRLRSITRELNSNHIAKPGHQNKRTCLSLDHSTYKEFKQPIEHPVLSLYFPRLLTLRNYLTQILASAESGSRPLKKLQAIDISSDQEICLLLDSTLVGLSEDVGNPSNVEQLITDATQSSSGSRSCHPQSEVVDIVLQIMFKRSNSVSKQEIYSGKPNNILCLGYKVQKGDRNSLIGCKLGSLGLPMINSYPNSHVNTLKSQLWDRLLCVIGEEAMFALLLKTSIFIPLAGGKDRQTYYQLCGPPISDSLNNPTAVMAAPDRCETTNALGKSQGFGQSLKRTAPEIEHAAKKKVRNEASGNQRMKNASDTPDRKSHGEIVFVRSKMFYSRPTYNRKRDIQFGLPHIHVLNRYPSSMKDARHTLMYLFPRQYGLHNVFTSEVNRQETVQPFQDYTLREQEIQALKQKRQGKEPSVPKRLKGNILVLVMQMQKLHLRCSYHALVKYYCPASLCDPGVRDKRVRLRVKVESLETLPKRDVLETQEKVPSSLLESTETTGAITDEIRGWRGNGGERFTGFASSSGEVSGFVRAVIGRVIPNKFFGSGEANKNSVMRIVDHFVKLRRYESLSLHEALQGLKLTDFGWLRPPSIRPDDKMSKTDETKRRQLLAEFIYWLFDSFIIPLLRSHFYITESGVDRNRVFYFRHDVWKKLSEPALDRLKINLFEEMKGDYAEKILAGRKLGFSQVRLLPKENGVRPIMNLRKKGVRKQNGKIRLIPGINAIMTPVFRVLVFEKERKPERIGHSMFSVGDMYLRMKDFQARIVEKGWQNQKLYFAKVDVQACFDTIPQSKLLRLVRSIMGEEEYRIDKYAEVCPPPAHQIPNKQGLKRPVKKFIANAKPTDEIDHFADYAETVAKNLKPGTVLVDDVLPRSWERPELIELLKTHIQENVIKIGKKYFKQKTGIPQGSILSSILCNFFYAELEQEKLSFVKSEDSLLLRLIDDFLLITLDRDKATRFLTIMHSGNREYGAFVNAEKSLVNFEVTIHKKKIQQLVRTLEFPYCGNVIHTKSLDIRKERERRHLTNIDDTLTVEYSRRPGSALLRKVINSFQIQTHTMYFDTSFNSMGTVIRNIYHAFVESAMKFHRYVKSLRRMKTIGQMQLVVCIKELLELAWVMVRSRQGGKAVTRGNVIWLGAHAFRKVLARKQSGYQLLLKWLEDAEKADGRRPAGSSGLSLGAFESYRY